MSTAQARAEARRKAILSRGTDRLSKLTSSARGEDATYINTESSITSKTVAVNTFVGEDPGRGSSEPPLLSAGGPPQPLQRAVSEDPNMELLNALMDAQQQRPGIPGSTTTFSDASSPFPVPTKPQSKLQKFLPLIHIISVWCLFAFFAIWKEPIVYSEHPLWQGKADSFWARWARLSPQSSRTPGETWQVQPVPFWGALATLELVLFSFRIFSGFDPISPPTMLSMALPVLPPPLRSTVLNGLRYFQMFGVLMDDIAAALISVGLFVYLSTWLVN